MSFKKLKESLNNVKKIKVSLKKECMKKIMKIISIVVGLIIIIVGIIYMIGINSLEKTAFPPEALKELDECQIRVLHSEKGLITYEKVEKSSIKCGDIDKINENTIIMIEQKKIINEKIELLNKENKK